MSGGLVPVVVAGQPVPSDGGTRRAVRVLLLTVVLLALAAVLWPGVRDLPPPTGRVRITWWQLTAMFAVAEVFVLHVQVRREAQTVSLSEIPLVLGLFCTSPGEYVASWVVGPLLVFVVHRRQAPLKVAYNSALLLAEGCLSLALFHLVARHPLVLEPRTWAAAYLAAVLAGLLSTFATTCAIALYEGSLGLRDLLTVPPTGATASAAVSTVALVCVYALWNGPDVGYLLGVCAVLLLTGYRTYASLSERHLSLERLYQFSQAVSRAPEVDGVLANVLRQATELLRAEHAEIVFLARREQRDGLLVVLGPGDRLDRQDLPAEDERVWRSVADEGEPVLLARGARRHPLRESLRRRGLSEAVAAPLRGEAGVVGILVVAERMGDVRTFDRDDVRLLETVANHAGVALQNGRLIEALRHEALHDALTELPNRALLTRQLEDRLEDLRRGASDSLAVMLMDLNGFKEVNDTLGHAHGDELLRSVARRTSEVVGRAGTVARLGGDEFAVLLPDADAGAAHAVGRQVLQALQRPVVVDEIDIEVGGSIGVALAPDHGTTASALLKRADMAMYDAKRAGLGLCTFCPAEHAPPSPQRLALVSELRQAIPAGELTIHVQPKALLSSGRVAGVEALVRWQHPQHGLLPPEEFIGLAERSGLIRPLTMSVLRSALAAAGAWRAAGVDMTVAVNLSVRSLADNDLPDDVGRLLEEHGVPAHALTLEITETSIMTDPARTIGLLARLAEMGVRLSVDDFGTGYSSLAYLKRLPVHEVKIDKSFVTNMARDSDDAVIVRSIIDLGANLSLVAVAEGVEDEATCDRLRGMGCTVAQGYHLSRPMPVEDFPQWLHSYERRVGDLAVVSRSPGLAQAAPGVLRS